MKKKGIAIFCVMLVASATLTFAGCKSSGENASSYQCRESVGKRSGKLRSSRG